MFVYVNNTREKVFYHHKGEFFILYPSELIKSAEIISELSSMEDIKEISTPVVKKRKTQRRKPDAS
jgi:hypothetical protein